MKRYEYKHLVSFEDTNLVGNVYFANFVRWQGKCRELFLKEKAPALLEVIETGELALITLNCSCQYFAELKAFDEVSIWMSLVNIQSHKIKMAFEYYKIEGNNAKKVAVGTHEIGCFKRQHNELSPVHVPYNLKKALEEYKHS